MNELKSLYMFFLFFGRKIKRLSKSFQAPAAGLLAVLFFYSRKRLLPLIPRGGKWGFLPGLFDIKFFSKKLALALIFIFVLNLVMPAFVVFAESPETQNNTAAAPTESQILDAINKALKSIPPDSQALTKPITLPDGQLKITIPKSPLATGTLGQLPFENFEKSKPEEPKEPGQSYNSLMRDIVSLKQSKNGSLLNPSAPVPDEQTLRINLGKFIVSEKQRLGKLNVSAEKQEKYLNLLGNYLAGLSQTSSGLSAKAALAEQNFAAPEIHIPDKPAEFNFAKEPVVIKGLSNITIKPVEDVSSMAKVGPSSADPVLQHSATTTVGLAMPGEFLPSELFASDSAQGFESLPDLIFPPAVNVSPASYDPNLPSLADVQEDGKEIILNSSIQNLAAELENNPVKIYNFVRNAIEYEPYFGAKKGALGCLAERLCNDTDSSSLTIALLRASGIPARYKKDLAVMSVERLKNLLGVDETKTVYAALFWNKVPVYVLDNGNGSPEDFETYDFTSAAQLALEWTYAEAFYEYDERGGNIPNSVSFASATTTEQVQEVLSQFPKKQWIPLDAVVKPYGRAKNEIVPDTVNFNTQSFWTNYLSSQNSQTPLQKYTADLQAQSGKNVATSTYQSFRIPMVDELQILPPALPYLLGLSEEFTTEAWPGLPNSRKAEVTITVKKDPSSSVVLQHKFFGSEINNAPLDLFYKGATAADQAIIDSYGGIHATPAALVDIVPYFSLASGVDATMPIKIGESLILQFDYGMDGQVQYTDQKFSVAGNQEGIYVSLSKPLPDPLIDGDASKILLEGNATLARQYLQRIDANFNIYKKALDVSSNVRFSRAVITQGRILNSVNGLPTTFDFKGLTLDASTYITDYSNRGNYKAHNKDFHLLFGLDASFHEGQIFTDIAGLEGISTVKGIQYASARPAEYTIHTITQSNEAVIDTLQLSANTKQNMHADVQSGNTIITPNKFITSGTWNGILYISLEPDGTGTYAIGEQSQQNGGFTTDNFDLTNVYDSDLDDEQPRFYHENINDYFIFGDDILLGDRKCRISKNLYNSILSSPGYLSEYGLPCLVETKLYGTKSHTYFLLTDGARFVSPGHYDYWKKEGFFKAVLDLDKNNDNTQDLDNIRLTGKFKFNIIAGTYSQYGIYDGFLGHDEPLTAYYQPSSVNGNRGYGRIVYGSMLNKLEDRSYSHQTHICSIDNNTCGELNWVLNKLGFPVGNQGEAAVSPAGTEGFYQHFIGGEIYRKEAFFGYDTFYVPIQLIEGNGYQGTGSTAGFPVEDPFLNASTLELSQRFQGAVIAAKFASPLETTVTSQTILFNTDTSGAFLEGLNDAFVEIGSFAVLLSMSSVASIEEIAKVATLMAELIATKLLSKGAAKIAIRLIPGIGWLIAGGLAVYSVAQLSPLISACASGNFTENKPPKYYCGKLAIYGALAALGIVYTVKGALNSLGVDTQTAIQGKTKLFNAIKNEPDGRNLKNVFSNNKARTVLAETANGLSADDVSALAKRTDVLEELSASPGSGKTVKGFINSGPLKGRVRHGVDPQFSSESYAANGQFAAGKNKMIADGITKPNFFGKVKADIDQAINIFKTKIGGNNGEIIFVEKTNGDIVLSPRRFSDKLPHPYLIGGDEVASAGTIIPQSDGTLLVTNSTGHYKVLPSSIRVVVDYLKSLGYKVQDGSNIFSN